MPSVYRFDATSHTGGLNLVLVRDRSTLLYVEDAADLTDEVIRRYDRARP